MMSEKENPFYTDFEAAQKLNLSVYTLRNWRSSKTGPRFCRLGRSIRYPSEELKRYADQRLVDNET
jgi:predicted DNA-binding transcriptional regulator AlpA